MKNLTIWLLFILFANCSILEHEKSEYGYIFIECTGQNQFLIRQYDTIPIRFSQSSDKIALNSLQNLKWNVLYLNGKGDQIKLTGEVGKQKQKDGETFFEFKLEHWYILIPFNEYTEPEGLDLAEIFVSNELTLDDFKDFEGKKDFDVRLFQRRKTE